jgi:DNA repair protein RadC
VTDGNTHKFVTIEQVVRAEQPETDDLRTLLERWGLTNSAQEAFWVIAINNVAELKTVTEVARGSFHRVDVHIPSVLAAVLAAQTDRFYVAHNHPSGEITPTELDMVLTGRIMKAANEVGLHFEDHIITGPEGWFSFYESGLITRSTRFASDMAAAKKEGRR